MTLRRAAGAALAAVLLGSIAAPSALAQSTTPQPRVAYAMHSARINQIRATPDLTRLVSVSEDKTLRVWRLRDLRLLRTIHVPSEDGEEGALRSLAITPDGREVIVGGWTGMAWSGQGQLYRFDLATGRLLQTLRGFASIIEALALSPDGRRLAVGLGGGAGLRLLELPSGRELAADTEYAERVSFADFALDGSLATTSADGCLRLYDAALRPTFRAEYPPRADAGGACRGSELGGVRFSPDGKSLAFGLQDRVELVTLDVASRSVLQRYTVADPLQRSLCCPNWSADGQRLHMHGVHDGSGPTPLYRVEMAGPRAGALTRLNIGRQRFTNVLPLPGGDLVFSTAAPSLARVDSAGKRIAEALPPNGDFRFEWTGLRVAIDGRRVSLPMRADGGAVRHFDLADPPDSAYRAARPADQTATAPALRDGALRVSAALDAFGYKQPVRVGAHPVPLKPFQSVRSWAAAPGAAFVALGTQWSVMRVDAQGKVLWERDLPAPAYNVNVSGNGRWIVVAVGDGTLRWFDTDGNERLGLFLHAGGIDWVAWRADGYYASSPGGDSLIGWLVNRGDAQAPDFYRAVQFERRLYRPDLVRVALAADPGVSALRADLGALLRSLAPARVTIESVRAAADGAGLQVQFSAESSGAPMRELAVFVNGLPVLRARERSLGAGEAQRLTRSLTLPALGTAAASVRVEVESESAIGADETLPLDEPRRVAARPGRLWLVAVGVDRFERVDPTLLRPLPFAANDARELAAVLSRQRGQAFSEVNVVLLARPAALATSLATSPAASAAAAPAASRPTKANILARLRGLDAVEPQDTVVVFMASHGSTDAAEYFFMTQDSDPADVRRLMQAQDRGARLAPGSVPSLLTGSEMTEALRRLPGRRILILDTCHAAAAGASDPYSLVKRSASAQLAVVSAARGDESSYDAATQPHGAFTLALIEALAGPAGGAPADPLTLREVFDAALPKVQAAVRQIRLRVADESQRAAIRQTPMLVAPGELERSVLAISTR